MITPFCAAALSPSETPQKRPPVRFPAQPRGKAAMGAVKAKTVAGLMIVRHPTMRTRPHNQQSPIVVRLNPRHRHPAALTHQQLPIASPPLQLL
jgi:hypothetical protein